MKIAFIDFVLDPARPGASGLSDIVWNMARELARLGDEVHIVGPYTVEPRAVAGVTVHRFPQPPIGYRNILGHILIVLRAWAVARRIPGLEVIHAPEYLSTGIIAPFSRVPVVLTTPGNIYERIAHGNPFDWPTTQVYKLAARSSARYCALIDAISNDMAWWWERTGAPRERIVVIPYGVDTDFFRRIPDARQRLGIPGEARVVLYAGRLSPEKNVDVLIRAVGRVAPALPRLRLDIVGSGLQKAALEELAGRLGLQEVCHFHGPAPLERMPWWYSAADVCVLPSSSEGCPRVMLEAMACGAPFVGTRISGIVDVVEDEKNGYIVPVNDELDLAGRLEQLCTHPLLAHALGETARATVRSRFGWSTVVQRFRGELHRRTIPRP